MSLALAAEATFVARTLDVDVNHMSEVLERAAAHRGSAFVEIYQNCKIFNDGVFDYAADANIKADTVIYLEHGRPLLFGKDRKEGLQLNGFEPEVVKLGQAVAIDDVIIHDGVASEPTLAFLLSRLIGPRFPECLGVFRCVQRPTHQQLLDESFQEARRRAISSRSWRVTNPGWLRRNTDALSCRLRRSIPWRLRMLRRKRPNGTP